MSIILWPIYFIIVCAGYIYDYFACRKVPVPHRILITGASSGIGKATAIEYALPGNTLYLMGRDKDRLAEVEKLCREKGASAYVLQCDVRDKDRMEQLITQADDESPIDLVIANAAVMIPQCGKTEDIAIVFRSSWLSLKDGVFNTIFPLLSRMQARRQGQIAIVASTAGLCSEPMNPLYSSSKVAITSFGEALRWIMRDYNVYVNVITPAAVDTPMTNVSIVKNMPGHFASPEAMAKAIRKGLQRDFMHVAYTAVDYWSCCVGMRDVPAAARDYYFRLLTPLVKKSGNFLIEFHPDYICLFLKPGLYVINYGLLLAPSLLLKLCDNT